jgi:hypothetical protein
MCKHASVMKKVIERMNNSVSLRLCSRYKICHTVAVYYRITAVSMAVPSHRGEFFFLYGTVYGYPVHRQSTVSIRPYTVYGTVYSPNDGYGFWRVGVGVWRVRRVLKPLTGCGTPGSLAK